jgi:hypothetical protein
MDTDSIKQIVNELKTPSTESDNVYFNLSIKNEDASNYNPISCKVLQNMGQVLNKQSDYTVGLEFFSLRSRLPLAVMPIAEGNQANKDLTPYKITFVYGGNYYTKEVIWVPQITAGYLASISQPRPPSLNNGQQDLSGDYYYLYSIQYLLELINVAMAGAYALFNAAHAGVHANAPKFHYDPASQLIRCVANYTYREGGGGAQVWLNTPLALILDGFNFAFNGHNNALGVDYRLRWVWDTFFNEGAVAPKGATIPAFPANPPAFLETVQEFVNANSIANVSSISIHSSSLAVKPEFLPKPNNQNMIQRPSGDAFTVDRSPLLTFHEIIYDGQIKRAETIYYNPSFIKYINLLSDQPLQKIELSVDLLLRSGRRVPLLLSYDGEFNVKISFKKIK